MTSPKPSNGTRCPNLDAEEALYDIHSMRAFSGLELGRDAIPDETTILNFRHLLERHDLTKALLDSVPVILKSTVHYCAAIRSWMVRPSMRHWSEHADER